MLHLSLKGQQVHLSRHIGMKSRPIKVVHITTVDMSLRYMLLNQLQSLKEEGYEVGGISAPGPEVPVIKAAGIRYFPVAMTRRFTPFSDLASFWQLYRVLKRERFTIVHTHTPKPGLLGQLAARLAGVPVVVNTVHGFYFHEHMPPLWRRFYIALEKIAAWCSDIILSQNQEDIQTAIKEGICQPEKIKYLGNGFDIERFAQACLNEPYLEQKRRELALPPDVPVVGFVGRLVVEKGILELLQAARFIIEQIPQVRFLFIGPIDETKPDALTPAIVAQYGLDDVCIFTGRRQDMPELYALMDVLVLPSHREGFPRTPMEASFMGIPSVVTDIRGCREVIEHGRNGWLVPLGDVQALAQAILQLLQNPQEAQRMGEAGRQIARERFDERRVFNKVKAEYARLLQDKGLPTLSPRPKVIVSS